MKTRLCFFHRLALAGVALLLLAAAPGRAHAAFILTFTQAGGNVLVNGSGTINLAALSSYENSEDGAFINASSASLVDGPTEDVGAIDSYYNLGGLTGLTSFGSGSFVAANSGTGNIVGALGGLNPIIVVPQGYTSGTALTDSDTYAGATFASLGFTPGTYVYTWGTGTNADTLTVTSAPEPSTWALLGVGTGALGLTLRRRTARV